LTLKQPSSDPRLTLPPSDTSREIVIPTPAISCRGCGRRAAAHIRQRGGVESARFEPLGPQIRVTADPSIIDRASILDTLESAGAGGELRSATLSLRYPLTSAGAAAAVEKKLLTLPAARGAHADPATQKVVVTYDPRKGEVKAFRDVLEKGGFGGGRRQGQGEEGAQLPSRRAVKVLMVALLCSVAITMVSLPYPWGGSWLNFWRGALARLLPLSQIDLSPFVVQSVMAAVVVATTILVAAHRFRQIVFAARTRVMDERLLPLLGLCGTVAMAVVALFRNGSSFAAILEGSWLVTLFAVADFGVSSLSRKFSDAPSTTVATPMEASFAQRSRWVALATAIAAIGGSLTVFQMRGDAVMALGTLFSVLLSVPIFSLFAAAPLALAAAREKAVRQGVKIRTRNEVERMAGARETILLDGAVRSSDPVASDFVLLNGTSQEEILRLAASATGGSTRPIARALRRRARSLAGGSSAGFEEAEGLGWENGDGSVIGFPALLQKRGIDTSPVEEEISRFRRDGKLVVLAATGKTLRGAIAFDQPLEESIVTATGILNGIGLSTILLSSGEAAAAEVIARRVGIKSSEVEPRRDALWKAVASRGADTVLLCDNEEVPLVSSAAGVVVSVDESGEAAVSITSKDRSAVARAIVSARAAIGKARMAATVTSVTGGLLAAGAIAWPLVVRSGAPPLLFATVASMVAAVVLRRCAAIDG
jgi:cation transport ATPase